MEDWAESFDDYGPEYWEQHIHDDDYGDDDNVYGDHDYDLEYAEYSLEREQRQRAAKSCIGSAILRSS